MELIFAIHDSFLLYRVRSKLLDNKLMSKEFMAPFSIKFCTVDNNKIIIISRFSKGESLSKRFFFKSKNFIKINNNRLEMTSKLYNFLFNFIHSIICKITCKINNVVFAV